MCAERARRHRLLRVIAAPIALALVLATGGCATGRPPAEGDPHDETRQALAPVVLADLEGLSFVRDGSIWTIEDGAERLVADGVDPWSLRSSRSGEAVTWITLDGPHARFETVATGDWRPETLWETELGSLVVEAVHDDVADVLWLTVSGEQTSTVGFADLARDTEGALALPVDTGSSFCLDHETNALIVVSAAQQPATLWRVAGEARALFEAATLFTPRCSPDGSRVAVTGSTQSGGEIRLWVIDVASGSAEEVDTGTATATDPVWSRDGLRLAFRDARTGTVWTVLARGGRASDSGLRADEGGLAW